MRRGSITRKWKTGDNGDGSQCQDSKRPSCGNRSNVTGGGVIACRWGNIALGAGREGREKPRTFKKKGYCSVMKLSTGLGRDLFGRKLATWFCSWGRQALKKTGDFSHEGNPLIKQLHDRLPIRTPAVRSRGGGVILRDRKRSVSGRHIGLKVNGPWRSKTDQGKVVRMR